MEKTEADYEKEYKDVAAKINDFTTVLNKYNLEYKIVYYDGAAGIVLPNYPDLYDDELQPNIEILFSMSGGITFGTVEDEEE